MPPIPRRDTPENPSTSPVGEFSPDSRSEPRYFDPDTGEELTRDADEYNDEDWEIIAGKGVMEGDAPPKYSRLADIPGFKQAFESATERIRQDEREKLKKFRRLNYLKLQALDDDELTRTMNRSQARYLGTLRSATKNHVLQAGLALSEMRRRIVERDGGLKNWKPWVKKNFNGEYVTATVYKRIAEEWDDLVDAGMTNATLEEMRGYLTQRDIQQKGGKKGQSKNGKNAGKGGDKPPKKDAIDLPADATEAELEDYNNHSAFLAEAWMIEDAGRVVLRALALCCELEREKIRDQDN